MANKYDLELAIDTYRAKNGKESEVGLADYGDGIQYGSQKFSTREQAIGWLKQQKPDHESIRKMIAEERVKYPNSGLNPLFEVYEKYYALAQDVQDATRAKIDTIKPSMKEAFKKAFLGAKSTPFTFKYKDDTGEKEVGVSFNKNTIVIGSRKHTFQSDSIKIGELSLNQESIYIPYTKDGKEASFSFVMKKAEFFDKYIDDILAGKDIFIDTYLVHVKTDGQISPPTEKQSSSVNSERKLKYEFPVYQGFAEQELKKHKKTVKDLQEVLKEKKHYMGEVSGIFNQETLDAVLAFQATIPNAKYGADGLVGSEETIPALFGIQSSPNTRKHEKVVPQKGTPSTRRTDGEPESPRRPVEPNTPKEPPERKEKLGGNIVALSSAMNSFRSTIKANDEKVNGSGVSYLWNRVLPTSASTVESSRKAIESAYSDIQKAIHAIDTSKLSDTDRTLYEAYVLEVARYFADQHDVYKDIGVDNRHWKNYDRSLELCGSILAGDFKKNGISVPLPPTESTVRSKLKEVDPKTAEKFINLLDKGYSWQDIMSNPKLRGAWDEVVEKVFSSYENKLQQTLISARKKYEAGEMTFSGDVDNSRKKAFELMIDIMGAGSWWDIKEKNYQRSRDAGLMFGAALAGIGATILTGGVAGLAVGAGVATTGTVLAKGQIRDGWDGAKDTGFELLINSATFGIGGGIAKLGSVAMAGATSTVLKAGVIGLEAGSATLLGASVDQLRAAYEDVGITWTESLKHNFVWALLPLGIQYKGAFKAESSAFSEKLRSWRIKKEIDPKNPTVVQEGQKLAKEGEALGQKVQAEQKATLPEGTIGSKVQKPTIESPTPSVKTESGVRTSSEIQAPSVLTLQEQKQLDTAVSRALKDVSHAEEGVHIGNYKIKDAGSGKVRVTRSEGDTVVEDFIASPKDAEARIKAGIKNSTEEARSVINGAVKDAVAHMPKDKKISLKMNGEEYTVSKGKDGNTIMTDKSGNVVPPQIQDAVWLANAEKALATKVEKHVAEHGHKHAFERIGPDTFVFKGWKEWNGNRAWYNPIKVPSWALHKVSTITISELLQPLKTTYAIKDALTTKGSFLGMGNNVAKAIVLRDIHPDWFSKDSLKAIAGRGLILSSIAPFIYSNSHKDANGNSKPINNSGDMLLTMGELYYGGLIWGTILSHFTTDSKPLTWEYGPGSGKGAQVPPPKKQVAQSGSVSKGDIMSPLPDSGQQVSYEE